MRGSVLLVGPDGAGKTTVLEALERRLETPLHRAHSRPGVIAGRPAGTPPVLDPHAQVPRGVLGSIVKVAIVFADTMLGSWLRWRPQARSGLLIIERGWYDLAVDPTRYRLPLAFIGLIRGLGRLVPRADVVVLLAGDPAELHRRKPEIGTAEVARQLAAWRSLASRAGRRVVELDTVASTAEECADDLLAAIAAPRYRWYRVPVAPRRLGFLATGPTPALAIYRPFAPRAQRLVPLNRPLLHLRLRVPSSPPAVPLSALCAHAGQPLAGMAAFRSSAEGRWIVGLADRSRLHTVIKIGRTDDAGLDTELRALESLSSVPGVTIPSVTWVAHGDAWKAIAFDALDLLPAEPPLDDVVTLATRLVRGDFGRPVVHGDLAPWNIATTAAGLALWDFENARLGIRAPLHDLAHYLIASGTLLGRYTPSEVVALLTHAASPGTVHLHELGVPVDQAVGLVAEYLSIQSPTTSAEAAFRSGVAAALPTP